uniref:Apoptosis inhibitor 5 n=1 Tax=Cyprinus carpio carpio TaxID=630221 RepID=A0A8C1EHU0_CYPCA
MVLKEDLRRSDWLRSSFPNFSAVFQSWPMQPSTHSLICVRMRMYPSEGRLSKNCPVSHQERIYPESQTSSHSCCRQVSHLLTTWFLGSVYKLVQLNNKLFFQLFDHSFFSYLLDDSAEFSQVNTALISIFKIDAKGTLGGLFSQILQGEDVVRERAIKFLSTKLKTMPDDTMTKEVEDYIFIETKKVLEDVTGEEFVLLMRILSGLKNMQTVSGRQQLVELVVEQAFLEQALNPTDADSVDRLLQCTRQALPLFSKNVHSTRFVTYFCEFVLPSLSLLTSPVAELDIQLEVLKLLAEMSPYCGDMDKLEVNLNMLFEKLLEFMPLPPEEENGENAANEEPKLQFSYVECLLFSFHQLGKKLPDFLIDKISAEKLKDFKIRLQYFARGLQVYIRQLRVALQGKTGDALKTEENKIKVVALKITNNINVLIKDLFHNPPSYKSTVTLSWKPVQKTEAAAIGQKRQSVEDIGATATTKKLPTNLPRRNARQIYNPPSGKYSASIGNFSYEQRGGFRGGRGRGFGGRGNRSRGRIY